jgi:hypothetical protein
MKTVIMVESGWATIQWHGTMIMMEAVHFTLPLAIQKNLIQKPDYLKHLLGGIQYAIGDNLKLDYSKAKTQLPPDVDRFTKTQLVQGEFFEPTEMTVLPNLDISLYSAAAKYCYIRMIQSN